MTADRRVQIIWVGPNQAVLVPPEFELACEHAIVRREGKRLIIEPAPRTSLLAALQTLSPLDEEFAPIPDGAPEPVH